MKCFLPHRSDKIPIIGVKQVRDREKTEKISPRTIPLAPRDLAYPGRRGAMMPTPSITVKTAKRIAPRVCLRSPGGRFSWAVGESV
jgi:hypothetical protein